MQRGIGAVIKALLATALCLGANSPALSRDTPRPTGVWARAGADQATAQADEAACAKASGAMTVTAPADIAMPAARTVVGGAVAGAGGYIASMIAARRAQKQLEPEYVRRCMRRAGYGWVNFTDDEQAAIDSRPPGDARSAWIDAFLAGDLSNRIAEARRPFLPLIAEARDEPWVVGGVRFDAAGINIAHQIVTQPDTTILTGTLGHRRTARLRNAFDVAGAIQFHAEAGTVMHQIVSAGRFEPEATYWCGPMNATGGLLLRMTSRQIVCVTSSAGSYEVWEDDGKTFLARGPDVSGEAIETSVPLLVLDESDDDLIGPMTFTLVVRQVYADSVALEARAGRGGKSVAFWKGDVAFGRDGKAVLPFWSHRLTITNRVTELRIAYTADGDGTGWDAATLAPGG